MWRIRRRQELIGTVGMGEKTNWLIYVRRMTPLRRSRAKRVQGAEVKGGRKNTGTYHAENEVKRAIPAGPKNVVRPTRRRRRMGEINKTDRLTKPKTGEGHTGGEMRSGPRGRNSVSPFGNPVIPTRRIGRCLTQCKADGKIRRGPQPNGISDTAPLGNVRKEGMDVERKSEKNKIAMTRKSSDGTVRSRRFQNGNKSQ